MNRSIVCILAALVVRSIPTEQTLARGSDVTPSDEHSTIPGDLIAMLDLLAETIVQALGFGVAVVNLTCPDGSLEVVSVAGDEDARRVLLGTTDTVQSWQQMLLASEDWGRLRFQDHAHALASPELLSWVPDLEMVDAEDAWHPEDALFAPLVGEDGALLGVLSVDLPSDGRRPDLATRNALEAFAVSVALAIEHATLRQQAELSEQAMLRQATHDSLTGLANRALLEDRLRNALACQDPGTMTALVFIDIDGFKSINDLHSHAAGDQVLRSVADRITGSIRPHDTAARWGGDEFLVLLERLPDETAAVEVAQRIMGSMVDPVKADDHLIKVTASMGVSFGAPDDGIDAEELMRRADSAMYDVKHTGRNGYATFRTAGQPTSHRLHLLDLLSRALREERLVVHYQPLVRVSDQIMVGVEALLRLRDDDGTLVLPNDFLPLARDGGTLIAIEHQVFRLACSQVAQWVEDGHDLRLSVNVCAQQLLEIEDFEAVVLSALADSGLTADRLICEITEHDLVDINEPMVAGISRLVHSGVRMSIDDFGTGFGSFTYVHTLPIQELKIDRSFVAGASETSGAILRSIAGLAGDLGMNCVAEGVETTEQHQLVREAGVAAAQGSLYSSPLDPETLTAMLETEKLTLAGAGCRRDVAGE